MLPTEVNGEVRVRFNPNPNQSLNPRPHTIVWTGGRPHAVVAPMNCVKREKLNQIVKIYCLKIAQGFWHYLLNTVFCQVHFWSKAELCKQV